jgi:hypothetical protein
LPVVIQVERSPDPDLDPVHNLLAGGSAQPASCTRALPSPQKRRPCVPGSLLWTRAGTLQSTRCRAAAFMPPASQSALRPRASKMSKTKTWPTCTSALFVKKRVQARHTIMLAASDCFRRQTAKVCARRWP